MSEITQILHYAPVFVPVLLTGGAAWVLLRLEERAKAQYQSRVERALQRAQTKAPNSTVRAMQAILRGEA